MAPSESPFSPVCITGWSPSKITSSTKMTKITAAAASGGLSLNLSTTRSVRAGSADSVSWPASIRSPVYLISRA